jgi:alpha-1,3-rhamnosyl/mannosyltransferase
MRVVVNQLVALGRKTGIGHYTNQLLRCLRTLAGPQEIEAFPTASVRRLYQAASRARRRLAGDDRRARGLRGNRSKGIRDWTFDCLRQGSHAVLGRYFRAVCRRDQYDLYHEPNVVPFATDLPTIATLHDLSVLLHPQWHPPHRVAHYELQFRHRVRSVTRFLVVSEFTRQEVIRHLNIPEERVTRTYCGVRPGMSPTPDEEVQVVLRQLGLPPRYLLYVGTIEPRKNVLMLLRAYVSLPANLRSQWPLLLVGTWGWHAGDVADFLHSEARHRGVVHVGYVKEKHLPVVYSGARALLFPSWYEGFGLPPVEMMACGGAVLASTASALVETVGQKAYLIDPADEDGWRSAIARVVQQDDWWRTLRRGVRAIARPFTWEQCAAETLAAYRSLLAPAEPPTYDQLITRRAG